jgi:hypothetical protein
VPIHKTINYLGYIDETLSLLVHFYFTLDGLCPSTCLSLSLTFIVLAEDWSWLLTDFKDAKHV